MSIKLTGNINLSNVGGGPSTLSLEDLSDVLVTTPIEVGSYLRYNNTSSEWVNSTLDADVFDYLDASLTGTNGITVTPNSGTESFVLSLTTTGASAGTYTNVTIDAYGRATNGGNLSATGDVTGTASGGSIALTLATVNSNVGTFGSGTLIPSFTVNSKGLITGVTTSAYTGTVTKATNIAGGTTGALPYQTSADNTAFLTAGTTGQVLISGSTPSWTNISSLSVASASNVTGGFANGILYNTASSSTASITAPTTANTFLEWNGTSFVWGTVATGTYLPLSGGSMTGDITFDGTHTVTNLPAPSAGTDAATKNYVDAAISGLSWKQAVQVATTASITLSGLQTIDGYTTLSGDRVLVKNQSTATQNGIYVAVSGSWSRATDVSTGSELAGAAVFVENGTANNDTGWVQTADPVTIGTTNIAWSQFTGSGTYTAGTGLSLTGNTFANTGVTSLIAGTNIAVSGATGAVTVSLTGTVSSATTSTNIAGGAANNLVYQTGSGATGFIAPGPNGYILTMVSGSPTWSVNSASTDATNLANGSANQIPYQTASSTTSFITAPTTANTYLEWNGSSFVWGTVVTSTPTLQQVTTAGSTTSSAISITNSTTSTSTTSGALTVSGGLGVVGDIYASSFNGAGTGLSGTAGSLTAGVAEKAIAVQGGSAGELLYNSASGVTNFITAPTTASTFLSWNGSSFSWSTVTTATTATTATNVAGGSTGQVHYQSAPSTTAFVTNGAGVLQAATSGATPTWTTTPTLTGTNFSSIPNSALSNSTITIGSTITALGASNTALTGLTGLTFTSGTVTGVANPVAATDVVNLQYLQSFQAGLEWKVEVAVATTANITLSGLQTIDGYTTLAGDRVLVKNQTTASGNGIYIAASGAWSRATDASTSASLNNATTLVTNGTTQANTGWTQTTANPTIGTTSITWIQFSGAGAGVSSFSAGTTGLTPSTATTGAITLGGTLGLTNGGTNASLTATNGGIVYSSASALAISASGTSGQVLTSGGAGTPVWVNASTLTTATPTLQTVTTAGASTTNILTVTTNTASNTANLTLTNANAAGAPILEFYGNNSTLNGYIGLLTAGSFQLTTVSATPIIVATNNTEGARFPSGGGFQVTGSSGNIQLNSAGTQVGFTFAGTNYITAAGTGANLVLQSSSTTGTVTLSTGSINALTVASPVSTVPGVVTVNSTTASTSTTTGGLVVAGGAGIAGNVAIGGAIYANSSTGTSGQILSSTGTGIQWINASTGTSFSTTDDTTTNATYYPTFVTTIAGSTAKMSSTKLNYNPSTGTFSSTVFTSLSDATLKTNIAPVANPLNIISELTGVTFNWLDNGDASVGLIAQDVEAVLPELVTTNEEKIKHLNYDGIVGVLVEAVKQLTARIIALESK